MDQDKNKNEISNGNDVKENTIDEKVEYDQLLFAAGEFGLYQILLSFKISPFYIFGAFVYFSQLFLTEVAPNHWCRIPELENLTVLERRNLAIPADKNSQSGYSHCTSYVANWSEVLITGNKPNELWTTQECQHGWEFNLTEIPYPTISSEFGWVCDKDSYQATAQSLFFVGSIIGGFIVGWVGDRFGRIPAALFANIVGCVAGVASTFTRNFIEFSICRIFVGMAYDNCMMMTYLLVLEYTAPRYRTIISNLSFGTFFTIGVTALPWISLACGDWKMISLVTSIPLALSLLAPFLLPESPQWLLSKGRIEKVVDNVVAVSKTNNRVIPPKLIEQFKMSSATNKNDASISFLDLMKRPLARNMFICVSVVYFCCTIIFDALVRTIGSLQFDFFVSFTVISCTEFPSLFLLSFILDLTGRKWLSIISFIFSAIFSFMSPFVGGGLSSVLCSVAARFFINMAFNSILQWTAELLPTPVRGTGTSIVHICGYVATCVSPFIAYLNNYISWLSLVVIGAIGIFGAALCLYLPETALKDMPQTLDEVDCMMRKRTLWDMPCMRKKESNNTTTEGHVNDMFEMN